MTVKKVWAVYFSGTGTTKKTVDRIARRLAEALGTDCEVYDYTLPAARRQELTIPSGDVAVVGCPTYAGRVPNLLMPYLRDMVHGEGALAVPVVLFGNRNYDDALMELSQLLTADGFSCVAGGRIWRRWMSLPTMWPPSWWREMLRLSLWAAAIPYGPTTPPVTAMVILSIS